MALNNIEIVRFLTQDNGKLPFLKEGVYIVSDEEIEWALEYCNDDVLQAARLCCHSLTKWIAGVNTKEMFGDVEVWNEVSKQYRNAIKDFLNDKTLISVIPKGVMPWAAGISINDLVTSFSDRDNPNRYNFLAQQKGEGLSPQFTFKEVSNGTNS